MRGHFACGGIWAMVHKQRASPVGGLLFVGAPWRIRTVDTKRRRLVLYPAGLMVHMGLRFFRNSGIIPYSSRNCKFFFAKSELFSKLPFFKSAIHSFLATLRFGKSRSPYRPLGFVPLAKSWQPPFRRQPIKSQRNSSLWKKYNTSPEKFSFFPQIYCNYYCNLL